MSEQQKQYQQKTATEQTESDFERLVKKDASRVEYVPYGEKHPIQLSVSIVKKLCCKPTKRGHVCSDRDALRFITKCKAQQLNPFLDDAYLVGYDSYDKATGQTVPEFSIITAINVFYKRAESSSDYDGIRSGSIAEKDGEIKEFDGDYFPDGWNLVGGWAMVYKKNRSHPTVARLKLSTYRKDTKFWDANPEGLIVKCAEGDALKRAFPFILGNLGMPEVAVSTSDIDAVPLPEERAQQEPAPKPEDDSHPDLQPAKVEPVKEVGTKEKRVGGPKEELQAYLDSNRIPFTAFQAWLIEHPNIYPQADSLGSVMELPAAEADRILRLTRKALVEIAQYCKTEGKLL